MAVTRNGDPVKVLVTGAGGGVGSLAAHRLEQEGHSVTRTDRGPRPTALGSEARYAQVDLCDFGQVAWLVDGHDVIVHCAAIADPTAHPATVVFGNNVTSTFNIAHAAGMAGVVRIVNLSSETVLGFHYATAPDIPAHLPLSESSPTLPRDPYGLSKVIGESILDSAAAGGLSAISLRPSWVQYPNTYAQNLGQIARDASLPSSNLWSYTDGEDLVDAIVLATIVPLVGHRAVFVVNPDSVGGYDLGDQIERHFGHTVTFDAGRDRSASAIDSGLAAEVLGWVPTRTWHDYL